MINEMTLEELSTELARTTKRRNFCDIGSWVALVISGLLNITQICFIPDSAPLLKWCIIAAAGAFLICGIVMIIIEVRCDKKARRYLRQISKKTSILIRIVSCPD